MASESQVQEDTHDKQATTENKASEATQQEKVEMEVLAECRKIRRQAKEARLAEETSSSSKSKPPPASVWHQDGSGTQTAKWQVKFPAGWMDLPSEASRDIESARIDGKDHAEYMQCRSHKKEWWDPYRIVFSTMQQRNLRSGTVRQARRVMETSPLPHVMETTPTDCDELPQTTPTEDDEIPRRGIWEEPEGKKTSLNKIPRS